jgi:hypothetical protein
MKFITGKIKLIVTSLTIMNIILFSLLMLIKQPITMCIVGFLVIQLILITLYINIVTYKWLNFNIIESKGDNNTKFSELNSKIKNYESLISKLYLKIDSKQESIINKLETTINSNNKLNEDAVKSTKSIDSKQESIINKLETTINSNNKLNEDVVKFTKSIDSKQKENHNQLIHHFTLVDKFNNSFSQLTKEKLSILIDEREIYQKKYSEIKQLVSNIAPSLSSEFSKKIENQKSSFNFNLSKQLNITYDRIDALMSIHNLIKLNAPLPVMNEWRVSSDFAHAVLSKLIEKKSGSVIDIGSGISTILLGYAVKMNGTGKVISLEHSEEYYVKTKALIKSHKLEEYCELYFCPLKKHILDEKEWLWYDISKVKIPKNISIISVDGPPGATQHLARYPALVLLHEYLNKNSTVFLDDGGREEEKQIAQEWSLKYNLTSAEFNSHKGYFQLDN